MLSGTNVIELATMAAAPGCGAVLADLGATVVKVETEAGDPWRKTGQFYRPEREFGAMFEQDNRGKKSISLDLAKPAGAELLRSLLARADVFLTNVRRSGLQRLGLDWEQVKGIYPRLVYCHLTGWGREGPFADKAGYDIGSYGAANGLTELGRPSADTEMSRWPTGQGDHAASMSAVAGIGLALNQRHVTGTGQLVDISLLRAGAWANSHSIVAASASKEWAEALRLPMTAGGRPLLLQPYRTSDGWIHLLGHETKRHLPTAIKALGLEDSLGTEPRFGPKELHKRNNFAAARALIAAKLATKTTAEWSEVMDAANVWYAPMTNFEDVASSTHAAAGGVVCPPTDGVHWDLIASPIEFSDMPAGSMRPTGPAPGHGENTEEVLAEIGVVGEAALARLAAQGAFGEGKTYIRTQPKL